MADTASWLSIVLGAVGGIAGSIIAPGIGTTAGASLGAALGGGIGGLIDGGSSDPTKTADQDYLRMLSHQLAQAPTGDASMFNQLGGQLASRGLGNSGVAGSAYSSLFAELAKQRSSNILGSANILSGIGATPDSNAKVGGDIFGTGLEAFIKILGSQGAVK